MIGGGVEDGAEEAGGVGGGGAGAVGVEGGEEPDEDAVEVDIGGGLDEAAQAVEEFGDVFWGFG
jgi:hypothetical protein